MTSLCETCEHDNEDCGIPPPQYNCNLIAAIKKQSHSLGYAEGLRKAVEIVKRCKAWTEHGNEACVLTYNVACENIEGELEAALKGDK